MSLVIHIDGGARGNPGPAGAGVVIRAEDGHPIHEAGYFLGTQTNNAAEYLALIRALQRASRCDPQPIAICSDSELLVRQLTGQYRVKNPTLQQLFHEVQVLLLRVSCWTMKHVRREHNRRADELANLAMDRMADVVVFDADEAPGKAPLPKEAPPTGLASPASLGGSSAAPPQVRRGSPASRSAPGASERGPRCVRVTAAVPPADGGCPAGGVAAEFEVSAALPAGLCTHAAHAILPTLLAVQNTTADEFASVPTLTVRCSRPGCGAAFNLSPVRSRNGRPRAGD
ncbi:MAG: reverse transcriptase-like protein [Phycisphaerae bacterium]|nr:reverse transcriptase-like protein [Phycisphaerae bacterium]MCZ2398939.1 reverse transcriptase-like protein [Phycisphaerae bacterium]